MAEDNELIGTDEILKKLNETLPDERIGSDGVAALLREFGVPDSEPVALDNVPSGSIPIQYLSNYMGLPELTPIASRWVVDILCAEETGFYLNSAERSIATVACGFALALPEGILAQVGPLPELMRSGVVALPTFIDSGNRGEVVVVLANISGQRRRIERGQRIAQMIFSGNVIEPNLVSVTSESWTG